MARRRVDLATRTTLLGAATTLLLAAAIGCRGRAHLDPAAAPQPAPEIPRSGHVKLEADGRGRASAADRAAVTEAMVDLLEAWLATDARLYASRLAPEVTRTVPQLGLIQRGPAAVALALPREWSEFERPKGRIAMDATIRDVDISVDGDRATALYLVDVSGKRGTRWSYDDLWRVLQVFRRTPAGFRLVHEARAVGLEEPGERPRRTFAFEFAVPVADLKRAERFYTPLLGAPELVTDERVVYDAGGTRFRLDARRLDGLAEVRAGAPNGYAIFPVADRSARVAQLRADGARFSPSEDDARSIGLDLDGNVFVVEEDLPARVVEGGPGVVTVEPADGVSPECVARAREGVATWLRGDASAIDASTWFDDRRTRSADVARGRGAVTSALQRQLDAYERSPRGVVAQARIDALTVASDGAQTILSYRLGLSRDGARGFRSLALATEILAGDCRSGARTTAFFAKATQLGAQVRELDYVGYPVTDLAKSRAFYQDVLGLGEPYKDEGWRGFWSDHAVFGLFAASPEDDDVPVARRANGYASFWVTSAAATHDYLVRAGAEFPIVPAINDRAGVEKLGGYTQIVANDSEGNLTVFTEYTGK